MTWSGGESRSLLRTWRTAAMLVLLSVLYAVLMAAAYKHAALRHWDESRLAMNALEMAENGRWLVTHYLNAPDMWNTKPPVMIWLMVISMKAFGYSDVSARLPAAIAAGLTVLLLAVFCLRQTGSVVLGFCAGVVLLTSFGFVGSHAASTADYDALLTLWLTGTAFACYEYVERGDRRMIPVMALGVALAILTKSTAGITVIPGLFLYVLVRGRLWALLKDPRTWMSLVGALGIVALYYAAREHQNPGYLKAVLDNEVTGRFLKANEGHGGEASSYLKNLWGRSGQFRDLAPWEARFMPWVMLLPLFWPLTLASRSREVRWLSVFATLYVVAFFAVLATSKTKLYWYEVPAYPAMALIVALGLGELISRTQWLLSRLRFARAAGVLVALLFLGYGAFAYSVVVRRLPLERGGSENVRKYVEQLRRERPELTQFTNYTSPEADGPTPYIFYVQAASLQAQRDAGLTPRTLRSNTVVICDRQHRKDAERRFTTRVLHSSGGCATVELGEQMLGAE